MKLTTKDLEAIRETIAHTGELRIHLMTSRSGGTCKARLWHPDGPIVGSASGYGYDKRGAALGEAIELLFTQEELKKLPPGYIAGQDSGKRSREGLYGVTLLSDGRVSIDGACGYRCMLAILEALGFDDVEMYSTGKLSDMVLARRKA